MNKSQITVVEDTFSVAERGTVVVGVWLDEDQRLRVGDRVEIAPPDHAAFQTSLTGVDLFTQCFGQRRNIGLLLGGVQNDVQIPKGSVIWLISEFS